MKKLISLTLALTLLLALLTGCAGQPATGQNGGQTQPPDASGEPPADGAAVKTGLSVIADVSKSQDASAEGDGQAQANISLVAVTVGDDGVIDGCVIDMVQTSIGFSAAGLLTTDPTVTFPSKDELGRDYGMHNASSIGKEWNEQAAAMAEYAVGKTVEQLKGIAVNEKGAPTDADLASSVTLSIGGFLTGIEKAVGNAAHLGAQKGDQLKLAAVTSMDGSRDAAADAEGLAQTSTTLAAVTSNGDTVTSCVIDAVQTDVSFTAAGVITTDLTAGQPTKNEMGDDYGMKKASSIGKEWYEQAAAFAAYVTGKTVDQVGGIAVTDIGKAQDAELVASVTIGISDFQTVILKAAQ